MAPNRFNIRRAVYRPLRALARDQAHFHILIDIERNRNNRCAIEFRANYARAHRIAVQADEQVEQRRPVAHANILVTIERGCELFGIVERIEAALLIRQKRVIGHIVERDRRARRERMARTHENMRFGPEQRLENQFVGSEHLSNNLTIARRQVKHAKLAFHVGDIFDNLVRLFLAKCEIVARGIELANHVDERVHRERIVLARHAEMGHALRRILVFALEQLGLLEHLARVTQEGFTLFRNHHALIRAVENMHVHFLLKVVNRARDRRLRNVQPARGLGNAAAFRDFRDINELLEFHERAFRRVRAPMVAQEHAKPAQCYEL